MSFLFCTTLLFIIFSNSLYLCVFSKWNFSPNPASSFLCPLNLRYTLPCHSVWLLWLPSSWPHDLLPALQCRLFFSSLLQLSLITLQQLCTHSNEIQTLVNGFTALPQLGPPNPSVCSPSHYNLSSYLHGSLFVAIPPTSELFGQLLLCMNSVPSSVLFVFWLCQAACGYLSSLTRVWTLCPCTGSLESYHWTARKSFLFFLLN